MKLAEIKVGSDFSFYGQLLKLVAIENNVAVLKDLRKDKMFTYGLDTLRRIVRDAGYEIVEQ